MWHELLILTSIFAAFVAAFGFLKWGRLVRNPERRNPWIFFNPGSGGA